MLDGWGNLIFAGLGFPNILNHLHLVGTLKVNEIYNYNFLSWITMCDRKNKDNQRRQI